MENQKIFNFSAGPGILPTEVFQTVSKACIQYESNSLSILEMSHRSKPIIKMVDQAVGLVKELLQVPQGYSVVFLQGGASQQFCMVPYNLAGQDETTAYVNTGVWASKAFEEAQILSKASLAGCSKEDGYRRIPSQLNIPDDARYLHITSNNTIYGTQYTTFPKVNVPLVADMSSDIFSRKIQVSDFGLIYAGAQKNMGSAGVTLVIVKDELLGKTNRPIPRILDYQKHIKAESMLNTPPVFPIYVVLETLRWLKRQGGVEGIQKQNEEKATLLYQEIDKNPCFENQIIKKDRSLMNVIFTMMNSNNEAEFLELATQSGLSGIKGHRSVGGFRASIYNSMPLAGIEKMIEVMKNFAALKN